MADPCFRLFRELGKLATAANEVALAAWKDKNEGKLTSEKLRAYKQDYRSLRSSYVPMAEGYRDKGCGAIYGPPSDFPEPDFPSL